MLNIPSNKEDPNYRYKMPRILAKIEGRGNGIKTNVVNMSCVAKALKRHPGYPTKFFGCELGALSSFSEKEDKAIVNGAHESWKLQELLDRFVEMYVLCPNCQLPEIDLSVKKSCIYYTCNACGSAGLGENVHKLATYIVKNPPDGSESTTLKKGKKTKEERLASKAARQRGELDDDDVEDDIADEGVDRKDKKKKKEKKKEKDKSGDSDDKEKRKKKKKKDENGTADGTDEKKSKKKSKSEDVLLTRDALCYDSPEIADVAAHLERFLSTAGTGSSCADFFDEVRNFQISQDFDNMVRLYLVLCALYGKDESTLNPADFKKKISYVETFAERDSMKATEVLNAVEAYVCRHCVESLRGEDGKPNPFSLLLKVLYDEDVVDEKGIKSFFSSDCTDAQFLEVKKGAGFFLQWLENAEVSSEGGDDDDEEEDDDDTSEEADSKGDTTTMGTKENYTTASTLNIDDI